MRANLKKILTWTNMSVMVVTLAVATPTSARTSDFGFSRAQVPSHVKPEATAKGSDHMQRQLACLARNVFYEARGESMQGQMAVAQVTVNRAKSGLFPRDLCAVVSQATVLSDNKKVCQFSWYCDADANKHKKIYPGNTAYIAAHRVLIEGKRVAKIDDHVMWFHHADVRVQPGWNHKVATQIGNHVFYKRPTK